MGLPLCWPSLTVLLDARLPFRFYTCKIEFRVGVDVSGSGKEDRDPIPTLKETGIRSCNKETRDPNPTLKENGKTVPTIKENGISTRL